MVDSMKLMRDLQAELPPPELSPAEALALRNESPEDNAKIADALGRLAPEGGEGVDYDAELVLMTNGDLKSTNPLLASSVSEIDYHTLAVFGLFSFDKDFNKFASADSVVSWQTSEDRMMDKIVMRDDLTWSDGTPITAHDVAFSFRVLMTDEIVIPAQRQGTDQIRWIEAYDDRTLVFFHSEALSTNEANMNFYVLPKHKYEQSIPNDPSLARSKVHTKLEDQPVVGGAYTLSKRVRGQEFVMQRRESYYLHNGEQVRDKPYFKTIRFKVIEDRNTALLALKAAKIHAMELNAEQWHGQTVSSDFYRQNTKASGLEWLSFHFCWNTKTPYFEDKRVRKAMSYAMDYRELLDTILYGVYAPCRGISHETSKMFPKNGPKPFQQDLDKAEELLDEAGWDDSDGDGIRDKEVNGRVIPFEFTLLVVNYEDRIRIATLMKECLESIGIICNVKPTEFTVLMQMQRDHKFQAAYAGWSTGADPDTASNIWVTNEGRNYGEYSNPRVDALFEQARHEFDEEKRMVIYGEIHNLLWEDQPYTWLFNRNSFYGFNKRLRGYNFSPRGPFHYGPGLDSVYMPALTP
ncbi:MAG: ABC transporter substrate-binding protein [Pirellulales bacterium]|nr:ABC transporter substrate-binding protein [Pirellulales bacterium]